MEYITINAENIEQEHICCCISDVKGENCVSSKKDWLKERFTEGLVFLKANIRGKVFIEYIPAEYAWYPIHANDYMHINCFWVSGQYKGEGYANELLNQCINDAKQKGKKGITIIAAEKNRPFLFEGAYLKHKGFQIADTALPFFVLYYLPFEKTTKVPCFDACVKQDSIEEQGLVLYYTNQCPHTIKYVKIIEDIAKNHNVILNIHKIDSLEKAQKAPTPFTTYSFFYNGKFITNEIFSGKKFEKFLSDHNLIK